MLGTRVDGGVLVVQVRLSTNLNALTIDEVVAKMQRSHVQLVELLIADLRHAGCPTRTLVTLEGRRDEATRRLEKGQASQATLETDVRLHYEGLTGRLDKHNTRFAQLSRQSTGLRSDLRAIGDALASFTGKPIELPHPAICWVL